MPDTLLTLFPKPNDLLALAPEELAGVLLELAPGVEHAQKSSFESYYNPLFEGHGDKPYPSVHRYAVALTVQEALTWLVSQGLMINDPTQPATWYVRTRRALTIKTRADLAVFRKGRILPTDLLQPVLIEKVFPQFLRGDHDIAVFQAYKEVEVAVRKAANKKGAGYPDDLVGVTLMRKAFHPEAGPLTDMEHVPAEREGEMHLFAGAIAHAKNPTGHRDVNLAPQDAARLVVFASHLLNIVEQRLGSGK